MDAESRTARLGSLVARLATAPVATIVLIWLMLGHWIGSATSYSIALAAVYGIVVLSVSLLAGWGGVWSVGHPALVAIGAYTASWGSTHGWGIELTVLVAVGLSAATGAFLGFAGARFSVLYIALLTLAFDLVVLELVGRLVKITGGDQGVPVNPLPSKIGLLGIASVDDTLAWPVAVFAVFLIVAVLVRRSALRMRLVAAKSHPLVARTVGIASEAQVALAFAASGAVASIAGILLGELSGFVSPEPFSLTLAVNVIAAAVLGGVGSTAGAVLGGAFMSWSGVIASNLGVDVPILQGAILVVLLIFLPRGVVPTLRLLLGHAWRRLRPVVRVPAPPAPSPQPAEQGPAAERPAGAPLLNVTAIGVRFAGLVALRDVSLWVREGEVLGVIGPNGAGKTTLVNTLSGLSSGGKITGRATVAGRDLLRVRATRRRGLGLGRTFQHAELFSELTVLENVVCTTRFAGRGRRAAAMDLLERVGVAHVAGSMPEELPFGLRKRVDLARAIAEQPKILLLDEPFGGLDPTERGNTQEQIRRLNAAGTTVLIIDHVLDDLFAVADRVIAFDFGTPLAEGPPEEVLRDDRVRASYLGEGVAVRTAERPPITGPDLIRLHDVGYHYGGVSALEHIDLTLHAGQVLGIVGANGAGKSTLGRIIGGASRPTSGSREVRRRDGRQPRCSVVPEGRALFRTLSIRENLEVAAYGVGLHGKRGRDRVAQMIAWLPHRLHDRIEVSAGSLSGGEQQMLAIARGLVGNPDVLVLDEPALGLAPLLVEEVYRRIAELASQGVTIVLLEQLLGRAASVCEEILVLLDGKVVSAGRGDDQAFLDRAEHAYFGDTANELLNPAEA
jgi:ABC-type branched-subunit amino acid transport system ATPase component/ABC-type branched-subunit amino acid transport system permease subunit